MQKIAESKQAVKMNSELTELQLQPEYRSDADDLVRDFYVPCLQRSRLYRRAVGFFTSRGLSVAALGINALIRSGGQMSLVASPLFDDADLDAIRRGYSARDDVMAKALLRQIEDPEDSTIRDRLAYLAWLIAEERLDVRIAIPLDEQGMPRRGIYHEKLGIFSDSAGNAVAFTGSPNETAGGLVDNFEAVDVFWSWDDEHGRVARKMQNFDRLWKNETQQLQVITFPDAVREKFLRYRSASPDLIYEPEVPASNRWRHQDDAVSAFLKEERGVLEMATGTGKTRTALRIARHLVKNDLIDSIVVAMDGTDLLNQWHREVLQLATQLPRRFTVLRHYDSHHDTERFTLDPTRRIYLASRYALPNGLRYLSPAQAARTLLVHDEVHRLGSPGNREALRGLSDHVRFRLGLSATPEREYDSTGSSFITEHVGAVIYQFDLADAIRRGILSPFNYYPLEFLPDDDDKQRLRQVHSKVAARRHAGRPLSQEEVWIELARVYKLSKAKLPVFADFIAEHPELLRRCIIFVETMEYGDAVLDLVHRHRHDFHTYYAEDDSSTLRRFASGQLACLITCHRLSEGIDIRSLENVILFSSARARLETIQRMGRCLRTNPDDPLKHANVVDFIRVSADADGDPNADESRRDWLLDLSQLKPEG